MANIVLEMEGLLDIQEALDELQIGYATLYRWIKKGHISPVRIGNQHNYRTYITRSDVDRIKTQRQNNHPQAKSGGVST